MPWLIATLSRVCFFFYMQGGPLVFFLSSVDATSAAHPMQSTPMTNSKLCDIKTA